MFGPRGRSQKRSLKNALRQALREAPGRSWPASWKLKSINFPPQEAPRRRHIIFLDLPERFEALPAATLGPHGAQKLPGSLRTLILDPPPPLPWGIFRSFSEISGLIF